jgi:transcription elongation GreA/GreB family factor
VALIGKTVDEVARVTTPTGEVDYEVVQVDYR